MIAPLASALASCAPAAADAAAAPEERVSLHTVQEPAAAPFPDVTGALWAVTASPDRILYAVPGEQPFFALACEQNGPEARLVITRFAPAPPRGKAILAMDGNGYIGRWHADAVEADDGWVWRTEVAPAEYKVNALKGLRSIEATIPGAGTVIINQNDLPRALIARCETFNQARVLVGPPPVPAP
ncbi:hypothetical protein [Porphyrobacter sp. GA68]|uniref:hypothetical protein n=1 Tax=Porphyrobacter sp. GA68 TaxID=2883480 RepID=UPI001D17F9BA|nr:hypothetical protein [Porphyrobacter sp. GA68]